ncbi:hypothetical protein [Vreelandella massiliensis]|uniref:hypothetical protein n=1 Tax=Vreelandella massiliensis TaxID=1816686 RepID=UPI00096A618C|nr:hypothetical protein [Halomonas massiliensis]
MADNETQRVIAMTPATSDLSRPVLHRNIELYSLEAQRVAERVLDRVGYSLFSIEVILQLIAEPDEIEEVEDIIKQDLEKSGNALSGECERLHKMMADAGITKADIPTYTRPAKVEMEISSPLVVNYGQLLIQLDELIGFVDALWINSILSNKQKRQAKYQWHRHLNKVSGRIIDIEGRTRRHAKAKGRNDDVNKSAPARHQSQDDGEKARDEESKGKGKDTGAPDDTEAKTPGAKAEKAPAQNQPETAAL